MHLPFRGTGTVVHGYKRGSSQLGFPTANLDINILSIGDGVYYGYAHLDGEPEQRMVMSIGNNPHFGNTNRSYEVHVLKQYDKEFYGENLNITICGRIRDMQKYDSTEDLIAAINKDVEFALERLK
jgi:riboflavin kinase